MKAPGRSTIPLEHIREAQEAISRVAHRTPLFRSRTFSQMTGGEVFLKAENLQRTGSFKLRGPVNKLSRLSPEQRLRGVVAASAGNHAQGVALAASSLGIPCTIVMPKGASLAKVQATRGYGAEVVLWGDSYEEAHEYGQRLAQERGLTPIHAFDDEEIIAGQGTVGLEICDALDQLDMVLVPVGGGGLIAGVALAVRALHPRASVKGVQAEVAPACAVSLRRGRRLTVKASPTIADGIAVARPGQLTFRIIRELVDEIVTVSEEEIAHAMVMLLERAKLLVEGAGAVGLAALLSGRVQCRGRRAVVILSGGNIDPNLLTRVLGHGLAHAGRYLVLRVVLMDRPGRLARLLEVIARADANVLEVNHHRHGLHLPMGQVQVEVTVETRDAEHATYVAQQLEEGGYLPVQVPPSTQPPSILSFVSRDVLTQPQ